MSPVEALSSVVNFTEIVSAVFDELMVVGQEIVRNYLEETDERLLEQRDKKQ